MPAKTYHTRTAQRTRTGAKRRTKRSATVRKQQGGGVHQANSAIIADSFYSLKLKEKSGPEVFCAVEKFDHSNFNRLTRDITLCFQNALRVVNRSDELFDKLPWRNESPALQLTYVLRNLRQLVPKEFEINIETDENSGESYIAIFRYCEWDRCWHYLPVGPTLLKLKKENRRLHDLFLSFLRLLRGAGIDLWHEGFVGNEICAMDDRVLNGEDEWEPEDVGAYKDTIILYSVGEPARYVKLIQKAKYISFLEIQKRAKRYKAGNPIANLIYQGCEILKAGYSLYDYTYMPVGVEDFYLELIFQAAIIWKEDDPVHRDCSESLDAYANEGIQDPVMCFHLKPDTKKIDFDELRQKCHWPPQLSKWFWRAQELIKEYTNE